MSGNPLLALGCFLTMAAPGEIAANSATLPDWFEQNRVQAHYENGIEEDLDGMYGDLHAAIGSMGARVTPSGKHEGSVGRVREKRAGVGYRAAIGKDFYAGPIQKDAER